MLEDGQKAVVEHSALMNSKSSRCFVPNKISIFVSITFIAFVGLLALPKSKDASHGEPGININSGYSIRGQINQEIVPVAKENEGSERGSEHLVQQPNQVIPNMQPDYWFLTESQVNYATNGVDRTASGMKPYTVGNKVEVFIDGKDFFKDIYDSLNGAVRGDYLRVTGA